MKSKTGEGGRYQTAQGWPWRQKKKEEQDCKIMQLLKVQFGHADGRRKKSNTGEDGSYRYHN